MNKSKPQPVDNETPDPFDPAALRIVPATLEGGIKKHLMKVPVGRPRAHDWFRVHPSPDYIFRHAGMIVFKDENEHYLVAPPMAGELDGEFNLYTIYTAVTRQGDVRLWPVREPGPDGRDNDWWASAHEAAAVAQTAWTRVTSNRGIGAYEVHTATGIVVEPEWPEQTLGELLSIAFKGDRLIDRLDHTVVRRLRGAE